jgi:predicted LPLAT superfamily acyltransferase
MTAPQQAGKTPGAEWRNAAGAQQRLHAPRHDLISLGLGRSASRIVLYGIAAYFLAFAPSTAHVARLPVPRARPALPRGGRWRHLFRHFLSFASAVHDRVFLLNDRFELFDIRVHNQHLVDEVVAKGNGVFLMGAHLGSFEVLRTLGRRQPGLRIAMAMYEENARKINTALAAINPNALLDVVALGHIDSMIRVNELLDQGAVVGMLGDRSLGTDDTWPVDFLGSRAELPLGPFRMAAVLKRPVLFMTGLYRGGNRYDIHFEVLADFSALPPRGRALAVHDAVTRYAALMAQYCRSAPYNWFNFFDFWHAAPQQGGRPEQQL